MRRLILVAIVCVAVASCDKQPLHVSAAPTSAVTDELGASGAAPGNELMGADPGRPVAGRLAVDARGGCKIVSGQARCWGAEGPSTLPFADVHQVSVVGGDRCVVDAEHRASCWNSSAGGRRVAGDLPVTSLVGSGHHQCALTTAGKVACWGSNLAGECGYADGHAVDEPTVVRGIEHAQEVVAGAGFSCAREETRVRCWGAFRSSRWSSVEPVDVALPPTRQLSAGESGACALGVDDRVRCWGRGRDDIVELVPPGPVASISGDVCALGRDGSVACARQFGRMLANGAQPPVEVPAAPGWVLVAGIADATALDAADETACVLNANGETTCFGASSGIVPAVTQQLQTPRRIVDVGDATVLAAGGFSTCVARKSGGVWCWGNGSSRAQRVRGIPGTPTRLELGLGQGCAQFVDGTVRCWIEPDDGGREPALLAPSVREASQISIGQRHACAITATDSVHCWDTGLLAQVRVRQDSTVELGVLMRPLRGTHAIAIVTDDNGCAAANGGVRCWSPQSALRRVPGLPRDVVQLCAESTHRCARGADGSVACWAATEPAKAWRGIEPATDLACSMTTACARSRDGRIACSDPDTGDPAYVEGIVDAASVEAGFGHVCALHESGAVSCWGGRTLGALGTAGPDIFNRGIRVSTDSD